MSADCTVAAKPDPEPERLTWLQWVVVSALTLIVLLLVVIQIGMGCLGIDEGEQLGVPRARQIVTEQGAILAEIRTFPPQVHDSAWSAMRREHLTEQLGALEIRTDRTSYRSIQIVFHRYGLPEIYEEQLCWIAPDVAERVQAGRLRLGEYFAPLANGWWWVIY